MDETPPTSWEGASTVLGNPQYVPFPGRTDGGRVYRRNAEEIRSEQRKGGLHSPNANAEEASAAPHVAKQLLQSQSPAGLDPGV